MTDFLKLVSCSDHDAQRLLIARDQTDHRKWVIV
jgi:hypothetical protein